MGTIAGLKSYLNEHYGESVFDRIHSSGALWEFHLHENRIIRAKITKNLVYDVQIDSDDMKEKSLPKTDIKLLYPASLSESVKPLIKQNDKVRKLALKPIITPGQRRHVKNKSLFPLMKERKAVFFTLLEGEILKGLVTGFSRYEVTLSLKGGLTVHLLRHAVYDLRDKKKRCFLKSFQEKHRDWEKSELYVSSKNP